MNIDAEYQVPMGKTNEKLYLPIIRKQYGDVKISKYSLSVMDFIGENIKIELKSRTCSYETFNTTMLGYNKILMARKKPNKRYVYLFAFIDGLYAWEYSLENYLLTGGDDVIKAGDDPMNRDKLNFYIPISQLTKISNQGCIITDAMKDKTIDIPLPKGKCFIKIKKSSC